MEANNDQSAIPNSDEITQIIVCNSCLPDLPSFVNPLDWQKLKVGLTSLGLQVWCRRCDVNVCHIDFEGADHPANTTRKD